MHGYILLQQILTFFTGITGLSQVSEYNEIKRKKRPLNVATTKANIICVPRILLDWKMKAYLLFLHRLKNLDNATFIAIDIYAFKNLTVLSSSYFPDNLVIILITEGNKGKNVSSKMHTSKDQKKKKKPNNPRWSVLNQNFISSIPLRYYITTIYIYIYCLNQP